MALLEILSAGASILGGLKGLKKQKPLSPDTIIGQTAAGVEGQAKGAREAGEKYGFNPLTLLGLGGAGVGSMGASGPPLASFDMISGGLRSLQEERSGENEQRRVRAGFENDLLRLEIDRLKSGGTVSSGPARYSGTGTNVTYAPPKIAQAAPSFGRDAFTNGNPFWVNGRKEKVEDYINTPASMTVQDGWTGGPIKMPSPDFMDSDAALMGLFLGTPQVARNWFKRAGDYQRDVFWPDFHAKTAAAVKQNKINPPKLSTFGDTFWNSFGKGY